MGFCNTVDLKLYDNAYWLNYVERDATPMGTQLTQGRIGFVRSVLGHVPSDLVDIGIGGGRFVREAKCLGYDVNPDAIAHLKVSGTWFDVSKCKVSAITAWDVLEHLPDPAVLLDQVEHHVIMSTPIYRDMDHCLGSKHLKKGEHVHYWTHDGLIRFMRWYGFKLIGESDIETRCGRDSIGSFAFERA